MHVVQHTASLCKWLQKKKRSLEMSCDVTRVTRVVLITLAG